jgi:hypothetical protein
MRGITSWALGAGVKLAGTVEAWTATANHTNEAKTGPSANTWYAVTAANQVIVPVMGVGFSLVAGGSVLTTVATLTYEIEGTNDEDPGNASAVWAVIGTTSHVFAAAGTTEYWGDKFTGEWTAVRFSRFQTTGTTNLSAMNMKIRALMASA